MEAVLGGVAGVVVGVVVAAATPRLISSTGSVLRVCAKEVIKGGLWIQESLSEMFAESNHQFGNILSEARAELTAAAGKVPAKVGARR